MQQNAALPKDLTRMIPIPLIVMVKVNGQPARALVDSGSFADFVSSTLVDQLQLKRIECLFILRYKNPVPRLIVE